jgi:hypothetical protein
LARRAQVVACGGGGPRPSARLAVDHAEERSDWHFDPAVEPGPELVEAPVVHADLAALAALALADQERAAARAEVWFGQGHRLADPEAGAPEHDDQRPQAQAVV